MTKVYKLTTQDNKTRAGCRNECTWGPGVTHSGTGKGDLCGPGFIHAYLSPELAVLLNPIHADIKNPKLWECETELAKTDQGLKVGGISLTTLREIPLPKCTNRQRVIFAILCAKTVFGGRSITWDAWADAYIKAAADAADAAAARAAAARAVDAAADAAVDAAYAAASAAARDADAAARAVDAARAAAAYAASYAADAAARVADAAAAYAARIAAYAAAAYAARVAARVAAYAARAAARDAAYAAVYADDAARAELDLVEIAKEALTYK